MLAELVADSAHLYIEDLPSPASKVSRVAFERLMGHQQVTDSYLLMLARRSDAIFITFDKRLASAGEPDTRVELLS